MNFLFYILYFLKVFIKSLGVIKKNGIGRKIYVIRDLIKLIKLVLEIYILYIFSYLCFVEFIYLNKFMYDYIK